MKGAFNGLGLFEGISGITLGLERSGLVNPVCFVEREKYCQEVLGLRYPEVPIWDDVTTFDGKPWKGIVDFISGGFPCQDISVAGKGAGITGSRSGLWSEYKRIISEIRPLFALIENVPMLLVRGFGTVLADLCEIRYSAEWFILSAADMGAPHLRKRIFILAYSQQPRTGSKNRAVSNRGRPACKKREKSIRQKNRKISPSGSESTGSDVGYPEHYGSPETNGRTAEAESPGQAGEKTERESEGTGGISKHVADTKGITERAGLCQSEPGEIGRGRSADSSSKGDVSDTTEQGLEGTASEGELCRGRKGLFAERCAEWWSVEPNVGRVADGIPSRVDRLKCLGNAVVPQCAEYIGRLIMKAINA
jgi:DNA (cytosine-5)-methyltransferase 1